MTNMDCCRALHHNGHLVDENTAKRGILSGIHQSACLEKLNHFESEILVLDIGF